MSRPGTASAFTPRAGTVHEWITSPALIRARIWVFMGKIVRLSTSRSRNSLSEMSFLETMYESNLICVKSEYSYLQYHCRPIAFKVTLGLFTSSSRYRRRSDGRAMKIKIIAGRIVQIVSMVWCSSRMRF